MILKANILEDYVHIFDIKNKQNTYFKKNKVLRAMISCLFSNFVLFNYLNR